MLCFFIDFFSTTRSRNGFKWHLFGCFIDKTEQICREAQETNDAWLESEEIYLEKESIIDIEWSYGDETSL